MALTNQVFERLLLRAGLAKPVAEELVARTSPGTYEGSLPTISSIVRDVSGRVQSWSEDGNTGSVTRDGAGRVLTVTWNGTTKTISRDSSNRVTGVA